MSHTWKFLPIVAMVAVGLFMLLPGGATRPTAVDAVQDCSEDNGTTIIITIIDDDTNDPLEVAGSEVEIIPDPFDDDGGGSPEFVDLGPGSDPDDDEDQDDDPGVIELVDICGNDEDDPQDTFSVELSSLPDVADDCEINIDEVNDIEFPQDGDDVEVELEVDCDGVDLSTPTPTSEVGPPATIEVSSSNDDLGCGATSIITIVVSDEDGEPVEEGTLVNIVADKGSVSPASGQLTADSSLFVFYTAPTNQGGEATITAASGSAVGETTVDIDCNNEPTQAPPPTTAPSGGIQPPNTGDGGLSSSNNSWQPYAGVAIILSSVIATLAVIRPRRS